MFIISKSVLNCLNRRFVTISQVSKKIRNQLFTIFKSISCSTITIYKNYLFADDYKSNLRFVKRLWQKQG